MSESCVLDFFSLRINPETSSKAKGLLKFYRYAKWSPTCRLVYLDIPGIVGSNNFEIST